jgi:uncharacterized membrane protein YbhN (UPF0104 family)
MFMFVTAESSGVAVPSLEAVCCLPASRGGDSARVTSRSSPESTCDRCFDRRAAEQCRDVSTLWSLRRRIPVLGFALPAGLLALLVATVVYLDPTGDLSRTLRALAGADPRWLSLSTLGFLLSLAATARAWQLVFRALGSGVGGIEACARYGAGSLANTFLPARLGDGARLALFARTLPRSPGRTLSSAGALAAIGVSRGLAHALVILVGAALGAIRSGRWSRSPASSGPPRLA